MKNLRYILLTTVLAITTHASAAYEPDLYARRPNCSLTQVITEEERSLVEHVKQTINNANQCISKIDDPSILEIEGMSTDKIRHLLNNLCSLPETNYLEIGTWKGSTWIAALYNNHEAIQNAVAIDNWSQFGGPQAEFEENCDAFLTQNQFSFVNQNSFSVDPTTLFPGPVTIYFYDGCHRWESQKKAFTYYNSIFNDVFIALVDDWSSETHRNGTFAAFDELGYKILFEASLLGSEGYRTGQYLAVIRKQ